jgi:hypothetical protein
MKPRLTSVLASKIPLLLSLLLPLVPARAATSVWTNTAGGNWSVTNNWSPNNVPAAGDTVFITNAGTYTVTVDASPTLAALTMGADSGTQILAQAANTLTLNGPSSLGTNVTYNFSGGTLAGTGTLVVQRVFNWTAGTMNDTGKTVFTNSATVNFSTAGTKLWRQRTVDNYAGVTYSGAGCRRIIWRSGTTWGGRPF